MQGKEVPDALAARALGVSNAEGAEGISCARERLSRPQCPAKAARHRSGSRRPHPANTARVPWRRSPGADPRKVRLLAASVTTKHQGCHRLPRQDWFCQLYSSFFRLTSG